MMKNAVEGVNTKLSDISEQFKTTSLIGSEYLDSPLKRRLDIYGTRILAPLLRSAVDVARAAVFLEDRSSTLIELPRVGKDGEIFYQLKVRSMRIEDTVLPDKLVPKTIADPRVTRIGKIIRKASIDELPQFRNVMEGEMSLVAPRPKTQHEVVALSELNDQFYNAYTSTRPGLTGLEQINGRGITSSEERIEYAIEYAAKASLSLDIDILKKTIATVATSRGAY
jgi:lipopolysaccharide/colanic/teichoic acid biosynthesis glycosyltransferase